MVDLLGWVLTFCLRDEFELRADRETHGQRKAASHCSSEGTSLGLYERRGATYSSVSFKLPFFPTPSVWQPSSYIIAVHWMS